MPHEVVHFKAPAFKVKADRLQRCILSNFVAELIVNLIRLQGCSLPSPLRSVQPHPTA